MQWIHEILATTGLFFLGIVLWLFLGAIGSYLFSRSPLASIYLTRDPGDKRKRGSRKIYYMGPFGLSFMVVFFFFRAYFKLVDIVYEELKHGKDFHPFAALIAPLRRLARI